MSANAPLFLGLTVFNGERYLPEALESALAQSFGDFTLFISDNASTDGTADICGHYMRLDRRIQYRRNERNVGAGPNFNLAFRQCNAPFYKWMAHDDVLDPAFLQRCMEVLRDDDGVVLAHTALRLLDDEGEVLIEGPKGKIIDRHGNRHHDREPLHLAEGARPSLRHAEALRRMNWCTALFGVMRADALRRTNWLGSYYEADRILLAELALMGRFRQIEEPLLHKRCHAGVSVLKSYADKARMMDPNVAPLLPGLRLRAGYCRSLFVGDLPLGERLACGATVARLFCRNSMAYKIRCTLRELWSEAPPAGPELQAAPSIAQGVQLGCAEGDSPVQH
ncbi:MAG: glycosyltransferase [Rhodospirillaceae bacterium]|nr:glycosyltransferase [Rhodospirillales bacterium]